MEQNAEKKLSDLTLIKEIAGGVSTQVRFSNRIWLALILLTFVVLLHATHPSPKDKTNLPFQLGTVDTTIFRVVSCPLLAILLISFLAAHAQEARAAHLAQRMIEKLKKGNDTWPYPRDMYDFMRHPSLVRVAPLPQLARGKYQFYPENENCPRLLNILTQFYYLVLKILAIIVYFILPCVALGFAFYRFSV